MSAPSAVSCVTGDTSSLRARGFKPALDYFAIVLGTGFPASLRIRLRVGFVALALSVAAELLLATVLQGRSLGEFIATRDPVSGAVCLAMLP